MYAYSIYMYNFLPCNSVIAIMSVNKSQCVRIVSECVYVSLQEEICQLKSAVHQERQSSPSGTCI